MFLFLFFCVCVCVCVFYKIETNKVKKEYYLIRQDNAKYIFVKNTLIMY